MSDFEQLIHMDGTTWSWSLFRRDFKEIVQFQHGTLN